MSKQLGRYHQIDAGHSLVRDDATKTLVCTFVGDHFVAQNEDGKLNIYSIGDEAGMPGASVVVGNIGDTGPTSIRALNRSNAPLRGEKVV